MIDNNIIQSLGAGSGIDTNNIVKQLTEIERSAPQQRIDSKRELTETRISDYGLMSNALSTLQEFAATIVDKEALFSKTASFTESTALVPAGLTTDVEPGVYNFTVEDIAQSQAVSFAGLADDDDAVGEGTLTFNFGDFTRDVDDRATAFVQDTDHDSFTITIDSENNSLKGLRDAINDADKGVQASIIFDGSSYRLSILAESGANNEVEIVANEGGLPTDDTDATGLSRFAFNETMDDFATQVYETQIGNDAELTINGLTVYRSTNIITDVVEGLSLDVLKADPGVKVTVTVEDDKAFAEQNIRDFVEIYNEFLEAVEPLFSIREETDDDGEKIKVEGSLSKDSLAKSILSRIRTNISNVIPGLANSDLTSLTNVGIRTELDGTLSINEKDFTASFEDNFDDVQKLFSPQTSSTSGDIDVTSFGKNTVAGTYDVVISVNPSKGFLNGGTITAPGAPADFPNYDTTGLDYTFKIKVNGNESDSITLPAAVYADEDAMAAALQSGINADTSLQENGSSVVVAFDSGSNRFVFTSNQYGASSTVSITETTDEADSDLGLAVASGTSGIKVSGTVNGVAGFGSANVLLPALGEPGEGLAMIIGESATTATVNFSRGFAGELDELIKVFLENNGLVKTREASLENDLDSLDDDQDRLDVKMTAFQDRLLQQFIAMERIINGLNSSGSFLDSLIDTLPFTSKK
ncbi:MAG: flagellar hook-associated protein 2 [Lentisphaeria bacterium]|jgi:flagellar hook-associated protein 2